MSNRALKAGASLSALALLKAGVVFMDAARVTIESLEARRVEIQAGIDALIDAADKANRDLTDDELAQIATATKDREKVGAQIEARQAAAAPQGAGRRTAAEPADNQGRRLPAQPRGPDANRFGFRNFGEYALAVRAASMNRASDEQRNRLMAAATTYGNEGTGEEGGFVVIPEFRREIVQTVMGERTLLAQTDRLVIGSNQLVVPKDDTTPWQTDKGILAFWEGEATQIPASKPALEQLNSRLNKLTALVPVTDELLEDALAIDAYLRRKAPEKMTAKINTAIVRGTGAGQPLGILNAGATVTVAEESGQTAGTILFANITKMYSRLYRSDTTRAMWLYNPDTLPQLLGMQFVPTATSPVPVWLPSNSVAGQPWDILWGSPAIPIQACGSVGNVGDLILCDMTAYLTATRGTDIRTDISIHLFFDQALTAFRFLFRLSGQPWRSTTITPQQSASPALGNFVTLATRS